MKVVLTHDWLTGFRGGERVLEALCEMYPDASLYTLLYQGGSTSQTIENRKIKCSFLDQIPGIHKNYRKFLPLFPMAVDRMKIEEDADLVISSSHCVIKGIEIPKGAKHLVFFHSPMRYIYDQFPTYFGPGTSMIQRIAAHIVRPYLKFWDYHSNKQIHQMLGNSSFVKSRIEMFYDRPAEVVYPFVDLKDFRPYQSNPPAKEDFYLMVSAFAPNKRVDLAVKTFNELGLPLKIVGSGQMESELKSMAKSNIEFMGFRSREEIIDLYLKAKGFIFPGIEDFGITPLESLASGTPIIAFKAGGVLETLNDDVAEFFTEPTVESLSLAVGNAEKRDFDRSKLYARAEDFSKEKFKQDIANQVERLMNQ